MIVVEIIERNRRRPARVIFNDDSLAEVFLRHARERGAKIRQLTADEARAHVESLRDRTAKRSDWRAGATATDVARRIVDAKLRERTREIVVSVPLPRQIKAELDRIARLAGRTTETIIRAAIAAFLKAARRGAAKH
ncbi:MAG: ribbon-helix-helix protein, CopG family [Alphaproteobacteria bacterium]|nr:ribbon-helix-helix protein, CopG family [Alphaproteobacteria bacterium]